MKKSILFAFIALFISVNIACNEVGTNNQIANGDVKLVEEDADTNKSYKEPLSDATKPETNMNAENTESANAPGSPAAVVESLYKEEENENSPFFQNKDRVIVDKYFTKDLADLIWKDAVAATDEEVGALDFDPLYDAQDAEVADLKVSRPEIKGDTASVTVTFLNFGEEQSVRYQLTKENGKWKISDINYDQDSLKKIYQQGKRSEGEEEEDS